MKISRQADKEIMELSESLKKDMDALRRQRHNPFIKNGTVNIDAYFEFVTKFNEFINHQPKPFKRIIEKDMRL